MEPQPAKYDIKEFNDSDKGFEKIWQMWHIIFPGWSISRERMETVIGHRHPGKLYMHEEGFCLFHPGSNQDGKIVAIGVLPESRGKGLGGALLEKAVTELRTDFRAKGTSELKRLELGSLIPRFWPQAPIDISPEAKNFFLHRGFQKSTEPTTRDLYKDIRSAIAPAEILEKVSKTNIKFCPWSEPMRDECVAKQRALFSWAPVYDILAGLDQYHEVMVAIDPDTNAQIGWTLMCSQAALITNLFAFLPLMPSKEKTGLIAAVGVDEGARGKGVGLALMVKAMENMRERGVEGVLVDSTEIRGFYEKLGFEPYWEYEGYSRSLSSG